MASDLDEAYAEMTEMFGDLGIEKPSRDEFDKLMGPVLAQAKGVKPESAEQLSSAASFDDDADFVIDRGLAGNAAFTQELQSELRRRLEAKKEKARPPIN